MREFQKPEHRTPPAMRCFRPSFGLAAMTRPLTAGLAVLGPGPVLPVPGFRTPGDLSSGGVDETGKMMIHRSRSLSDLDDIDAVQHRPWFHLG
jgi:hypothetical protein